MKGAIEKAYELQKENPKAWIPQQFDNEANTEIHRKTTAQEIINDFPGGLDYVITGVGTGGHITAIAEVVKQKFPSLKVLAVEPELSPVLSGGSPSPHPLQGLGAGFVPSILNTGALDGIVTVGKDEAYDFAKRVAKEEGIFVGISTGAALAAVAKKLPEIPKGSKVLTFNYDTGERYLSVDGLF
jgi:cysteine synthase A